MCKQFLTPLRDAAAVMNMKPQLDRRIATRHKCRIAATLCHEAERSHVMILDYSDTALQIWVRDVLTPGADVQVCINPFTVEGRVLWFQQKSAGIELTQPMGADFRRMLEQSRAPKVRG